MPDLLCLSEGWRQYQKQYLHDWKKKICQVCDQERSDKMDGTMDIPNGRKEECEPQGYAIYSILQY